MTKCISYLVSAMMMLSAFIATPVFAQETDDAEIEETNYLDSSNSNIKTLENGKCYYFQYKELVDRDHLEDAADYIMIWKSVSGKSTALYSTALYETSEAGQFFTAMSVEHNFVSPDKEMGSRTSNTENNFITVSGDDIQVGYFEIYYEDSVETEDGNFEGGGWRVGASVNMDEILDLEEVDRKVPREIVLQEGQTILVEKNTDVSITTKIERATGLSEYTVAPLSVGSHGTRVRTLSDGSTETAEIKDTVDVYYTFPRMGYISGSIPNKGESEEIHCDSGSILVSLPDTNLPYYDLSGLFEDIPETMWYHDVVYETFKYGLMTGTDASHFEPNSQMTRAMVATVLYRMAGSPEVTGNSGFSDVPDGMYYSDPVTWAVQAGVVTGYTTGDKAGTFGPNDNVTREQLCTMAYRYLDKVAGKDTSAQADLDGFKDKDQVSGYALDAVKYCVAKGIISGAENGTMLYPLNNATRAECAKILLNTSKVE